jgi:hypothetical protein
MLITAARRKQLLLLEASTTAASFREMLLTIDTKGYKLLWNLQIVLYQSIGGQKFNEYSRDTAKKLNARY